MVVKLEDLAERWEKNVENLEDKLFGVGVLDCARELREFLSELWVPVSERLPDVQQVVQVRVRGVHDEKPWYWVGVVVHGMAFGDKPMPLEWRDPLTLDHKGRMGPLQGVTHWSRLGAA